MLYNRKQLAELLNTSTNSIKKMDQRNTLEDNLKKHGYTLINKTKKGKNIFYEVENISEEKQTLYNIDTYVFNVNDPVKFNKYFIERTSNTEIPITLAEMGERVDTTAMTVHNWDNKLKEKEIICNDGFFYMKRITATGETFRISKEEYNTYWKNKKDSKVLKNVIYKACEGVISVDEAVTISQQIAVIEATLEGYVCFRIKKFRLYENNQLYIDIRDMILGVSDFK